MRRPGFTALEVLIASAVSIVVVVAAIALMGFLNRMSRISEQRYQDTAELGILHETIRRAMQTLVAEVPPEQAPGAGPDELASAPADEVADEEEVEGEEAAAEADEGEDVKSSRPDSRSRPNPFSGSSLTGGARFVLEPQIPGRIGESDPRRLEVVLLEQPAPGPLPLSPTVRGVFELAPQVYGLALQWRSLNPPGLPIVLATGIREVRWTALSREFAEDRFKSSSSAWRTDMEATIAKEYPKAVRLELITMNNTRVDWLFEPAVTTGPEP